LNIIEDGYSIGCRTRPDPKLESDLLASDPHYLILSDSETATLQSFINEAVNNLYIMNYTTDDEKEVAKQRDILLGPDIAQLANTALDTQARIRFNLVNYKLITNISSAQILEEKFVTKYATVEGDTIYRVWSEFPLQITTSDNSDLFFEYNPQYYKGETMIDVWMYIKIPADSNTDMQVVGLTEILETGSFVSIYNGTSNVKTAERPSTIIEKRSAEYVDITSLSKDQTAQMAAAAKTFEESLYSGDKTTLTADSMKKAILPLCTDELKSRLTKSLYFEAYSKNINDTNATLLRMDLSSIFAGMTQNADGGYMLQEFQLDNGSMAYLCYDSWQGSLVADRDLDKTYGLNRCELQNGSRIYTTYFFFELVDGKPYISDFTTYETGMGESNGTGNG